MLYPRWKRDNIMIICGVEIVLDYHKLDNPYEFTAQYSQCWGGFTIKQGYSCKYKELGSRSYLTFYNTAGRLITCTRITQTLRN